MREAKARKDDDRREILQYIDEEFGIEQANEMVGQAVLASMVVQVLRNSYSTNTPKCITEVSFRLSKQQRIAALETRDVVGDAPLSTASFYWSSAQVVHQVRLWLEDLEPSDRQRLLLAKSSSGETFLSESLFVRDRGAAAMALDLAENKAQLLDARVASQWCLCWCCCTRRVFTCARTVRTVARRLGWNDIADADADQEISWDIDLPTTVLKEVSSSAPRS